MNHPNLADNKHCTGCMACADSCPREAITCVINYEGHYSYSIDESKCILCHRCERICPVVSEMSYGNNNLLLSQPYIAWSKDKVFRMNATSGGVFPAVACYIIRQGGLVFGAVQEQFYVHHEGVDTIEDIRRLQGSKYTQSKTIGVFQKVNDSLKSGRKVLFTGVGCQVAALLSFCKGNKNLKNLTTIDLICGGVPSSFLISKYIEEFDDEVQSLLSYRTKGKYEFTILNKKGEKQVLDKELRPLPFAGFSMGFTNRWSCYDCPFAKGHRVSDMTIGDYWGNKFYMNEKEKGLSIVIVHSEKGLNTIHNADIEMHGVEWRDFLFSSPRIVYGKANIPYVRYKLSNIFKRSSYNKLQELLANKGSLKHPWTYVMRIYRIIEGKFIVKIRRGRVQKVLNECGL